VTKPKKKYLWSWAVAGVAVPLLLLLIGLFIPKPPDWNPFQEPKISPAQQRIADAAVLLWPTELVVEVLGLVVTDSGVDASALLPTTIIITVSLLLNSAIYAGIGLIFWFLGENISSLFQRSSPK